MGANLPYFSDFWVPQFHMVATLAAAAMRPQHSQCPMSSAGELVIVALVEFTLLAAMVLILTLLINQMIPSTSDASIVEAGNVPSKACLSSKSPLLRLKLEMRLSH